MITLHQFPAIWGLPSLTPFGTKVETYLRMTNTPYQVVFENTPRKGPKNKMPMIVDNTKMIADSSFIVDYLKSTYHHTIDDDLTAEQNAQAYALQQMIEQSLYFIILYSRWIDPDGYHIIKQAFTPLMPPGIKSFALAMIRRSLKKQSYAQGISRHSKQEVYHLGKQHIDTIAELLPDSGYYFGDKPHSIDATLYAFLQTIRLTPIDNPLRDAAQQPKIIRYCNFITDQLYS